MMVPDPEIERLTLKLRDAFRVFAWEMSKKAFDRTERVLNQNIAYSNFYSIWRTSRVVKMDFFQLKDLAISKGFTVEEMLAIRARYYGLNHG